MAERPNKFIRLQHWSAGFIAVVFLYGCQVPLQDTVETFLDAVADQDIRLAACFLTPELKQAVTNVPYACDAYLYRIKRITWQINNMYTEPNGIGCAAVVSVTWKGASAYKEYLLLMSLKRMPPRNRWYISGITVQGEIQQRVEINSLAVFIRRFDANYAARIR